MRLLDSGVLMPWEMRVWYLGEDEKKAGETLKVSGRTVGKEEEV